MNKLIETEMYKYAKLYANKLNGKTGLDFLDEKLECPRYIHNAGLWFGFVIGFKVCYALLTAKED